ncbi:MAG: molybdenum cofactor guanylyltransferase [Thermodesulfobacteriota bacterium]
MKKKVDSDSHKRYRHIAGLILAGGLSKRYGQNKAFLQINGIRLIDHIAEQMKRIFTRVLLVTNQPREFRYLQLPVVEDLIKGLGPLGGLYTGLSAISEQAGFFVACDMPLLHQGLIRYMVNSMDAYDAVVPSVGKWLEPMHAVYARSCLPAIKGLIDKNCYPVRLFYDQVAVRYIQEEEIRRFCSPGEAFLNINTPEEFDRIRYLLKVHEAVKQR